MIIKNYMRIIGFIFFCTLSLQAQEGQLELADKKFERFAYMDAIKNYEDVAAKGYESVGLFQKLGDAYYYTGNLTTALKWYNKLYELNPGLSAEYFFRYSQALKSAGDYDNAARMMEQFTALNASDSRSREYNNNKAYLDTIKKNSGRYTIYNPNINSSSIDYGPAFFGNRIVFASTRDTIGYMRKIDKWTNHGFTRLHVSARTRNGMLGTPSPFSEKVDTRFHESTPVFTKSMVVMYFTRNNYNKGKKRKDKDGKVLLKIYRAIFDGKNWVNVTELPFNGNDFNTAHPALSEDEKTLYFASDRPGSIGGSDIFKVSINKDGTYGTPENLGPGINTEGRETFPFISNDKLYFASDGHPGLGGLDVFVSRSERGVFKKVYNVGEPVNGPTDDFAFIIKEESKSGFFTSNRPGGEGNDDIYGITEVTELVFDCKHQVTGLITDSNTGKVFPKAKVSFFNEDHIFIQETETDAAGIYSFKAECGKKYFVKAYPAGCTPKEVSVTTETASGETQAPISLAGPVEPKEEKAQKMPAVRVGIDLARTFNIEDIYFDMGKYDIRPDAAQQLEKIINFMIDNPTAKLDVRSHTDSRASAAYNQSLSDNRAKSIIDYLVMSGIDPDRLTGKGYGETMLLNKCADGIKCSEAQHQQNRRSEFIVMAL